MEHEPAAAAPAPAPPVVVAAPVAVGGAPLGVEQVLSLQRTAGNRAVCRAIASGLIQRDAAVPAAGGLTGIKVAPQKATNPLEAGVTITAQAQPAGAAGVTFSLDADSVAPAAGTTIDASTGRVTVDPAQQGGTMKAKATGADGAWFDAPFAVVEKPNGLAAGTTGAASGDYQGSFTHTLTAPSGKSSGLEHGNINEKFPAPTVKSPFKGGSFTVQANARGSQGWDLDASGMMTGTDDVSIPSSGVDAGPFVACASNPTPAQTLPAGFPMTQEFHAKSFPSGALDSAAFTTTQHVRTLDEDQTTHKLVFKIKAGDKEVSMPYTGPAVYRNAKADKASVTASPPKPAAGDWKRNEVQVTVSAEGSGASPSFSIVGADLGCEVDFNGKVKVGSQAGTITVRAGDKARYDEVKITIVSAGTGTGAAPTDAGGFGAAVPELAGVGPE